MYVKLSINIIYLLFSLFFTCAEVTDEIVVALKQGKASELVKYFDDKVTIKLSNQEDVLSKSQAEANLKYFFDKHTVKSFTSPHTTSSNNNSTQYITGLLETSNGKFKVSVLVKRGLISQIRIEDDNDWFC